MLIRNADVFITNFMRPAQAKLKITYEELRTINPRLIYGHGQGNGPRGPEKDEPGFDGITYWTRGGFAHIMTEKTFPSFVNQRPAFGDVLGWLSIAAGIGIALYQRSVTGKGCVVDVSLMGVAAWHLAPDIIISNLHGKDNRDLPRASSIGNPLFETKDGRFLRISMLRDQFWFGLFRGLGRLEVLEDARFSTPEGRAQNGAALNETVGAIIKGMTLQAVKDGLRGNDVPWAPLQSPFEFSNEAQVRANEYVYPNPSNSKLVLTAPPMQFNHHGAPAKWGAPKQGEHTDAVLSELGLNAERVAQLKAAGVVAGGSKDEDWDKYGILRTAERSATVPA